MVNNNMDLMDWLRKRAEGADADFLREAVNYLAGLLMDAEVSAMSGAALCSTNNLSLQRVNNIRR